MSAFREVTQTIEVPRGTGVEGFMRTIQEALKTPYMQNLSVDARGRVQLRYLTQDIENDDVEVDFTDLMPYAIIRNREIQEVSSAASAALTVCQLFRNAATDHLYPLAFVSGTGSTFWAWYLACHAVEFARKDELYGVPYFEDASIPETSLCLCAGARGAPLAETVKTYKVTTPLRRSIVKELT